MMAFLMYDLKVAALVAVFYMFYRLLLSRETFHRTNRVVLLTTAVASFVLPLCIITLHKTIVVSGSRGMVSLDGLGAMAEMAEPQTPLWQAMVMVLFFTGMAVTLVNTIVGILKVWHLISHSEKHPQEDGTIICVVDGEVSPFSWMRYIVLSRSDYNFPPLEGSGEALILAHERGHIRQHHSADVLLVDTLTALQWFNPAMWMLRQDLRAIHEYEADAAVLSQGINMRQYQYLLIQKAVSHCGYSVANGITHSTLKNRIHMMLNNKKTHRASWLKLLAMLPIVGAALALNAETVNEYVYEDTQEQPQKQVVKKKGRKDAQVTIGDKTIEVKADKSITKDESTDNKDSKKSPLIVFTDKQNGPEPMFIIDGKRATREQVILLDSKTIDHIDVLKEKSAVEVYGEEGKNGVVIITTKGRKNGDIKEVVIKVKEPQEAEPEKKPNAVVSVDAPESDDAFDVVEQMPEYPGGIKALMNYLSFNVKYPKEAMTKGIEGRVLVQFVIEKDGSIAETKVVKQVDDLLDAEAIRVVNAMPKWKPGMQKGQAVRVKYTLPISFRLK